MARRKITRRFDPRYFMSEKTDIIKEGMRMSPEDLDRQEFERLAQILRDDYGDKIEKVEVLSMDGPDQIPYVKVTFLNGVIKHYEDPIRMEADISDLAQGFEL